MQVCRKFLRVRVVQQIESSSNFLSTHQMFRKASSKIPVASTTYDFSTVERKWQSVWEKSGHPATCGAPRPSVSTSSLPKHYVLSMFPYPSGKLHMGHVRVYAISDCIARVQRMKGFDVLHPIGWDAFGLPAENAAIERGESPEEWTQKNISHMKKQLTKIGVSFDWDREVTTCQPDYYRWTQWIFTQLYDSGLAYQKDARVNWDPVDKTVLANEQVDGNGRSWRSGAIVEQKLLKQWFFKISNYADRLVDGCRGGTSDSLEKWPTQVRRMQENWIGQSTGLSLDFSLDFSSGSSGSSSIQLSTDSISKSSDVDKISVFTTRPDTVYGISYLAVAPEHKLNDTRDYAFAKEHNLDVKPVIKSSVDIVNISDNNQNTLEKVFTDKGILISSGDFNGMDSDEATQHIIAAAENRGFGSKSTQYRLRDWLVSRQRHWGAPIPIIYCNHGCGPVSVPKNDLPVLLPSSNSIRQDETAMNEWKRCICPKCGGSATRETDTLDTFVDSSWYFARYIDAHNDNEAWSPKAARDWLPVSTYIGGVEHAILHLLYARFINMFLFDKNLVPKQEPFSRLVAQGMVLGETLRFKKSKRYLTPKEAKQYSIDGNEAFENDEIVEKVWEKMSKSKYNGVDPDEMVAEFGADVTRIAMLFKAPPEKQLEWDSGATAGSSRWLDRLWRSLPSDSSLSEVKSKEPQERQKNEKTENNLMRDGLHSSIYNAVQTTIKNVTRNFSEDVCAFNVAIADLMKLTNLILSEKLCPAQQLLALRPVVLMMSPIAPHFSAEMWEKIAEKHEILRTPPTQKLAWAGDIKIKDVHLQSWPIEDKSCQTQNSCKVIVQLKGKTKGVIQISGNVHNDVTAIENAVRSSDLGTKLLGEKNNQIDVKRVIVVSKKDGSALVNFVL